MVIYPRRLLSVYVPNLAMEAKVPLGNQSREPAPPTHSNVYWGDSVVTDIKNNGGKCTGVVHEFNMTWGCGHTGSAVEVHVPTHGTVKACVACAKEFGLPGAQ